MASRYRVPRCRRRRPPLLLLPLLTWYLLQLTGISGEDRPVLCERNVCKNDGICYKMKTDITYDWSSTSTTTFQPSSTPQPTTEPPTAPTTVPTEPSTSPEPTGSEPTTSVPTPTITSTTDDHSSDFLMELRKWSGEEVESTGSRVPRALTPLRILDAELPKLWKLEPKEEVEEDEMIVEAEEWEEEEGLQDAPPPPPLQGSASSQQTCYCDEGYEGDDCSRLRGNEKTFFRETKIGDGTSPIIVEFGALGRLPTGASADCAEPDTPLPANSEGCIAPSSEAILRYWCQGKLSCVPSIEFLSMFEPDSCQFSFGYNVSSCLYLRFRQATPGNVTRCQEGATYDAETQTCYVYTASTGEWSEQRAQCRALGGDMAYLPSNDTYPGFRDFLRELDIGHGYGMIWVAGESAEPRPVVDMRASAVQNSAKHCVVLDGGSMQNCSSDSLHAVCALSPWPEDVTPDCSNVKFQQYNVTFPLTAAGSTVRQPCGDGYTGTASYDCGLDGQWNTELPDLSLCRSENIDTKDVKERLDNGTEPVSNIVSELAANVSQSGHNQSIPLTAGDVISSVELLPQMLLVQQAQLSGQQDQQTVQEYVGNVTLLVGELTWQESSWQTMPRANRSQTASTLQTSMEQSAYLLAELLKDEQEDFDQDTIRVRAGRFSSLDQENRQYVTRQNSSVTLPEEVGTFSRDGNTSIVFVEYANLDCLLSGQKCRTADEWRRQPDLQYSEFVNSPVLSASVDNTSVRLNSSNVTLRFRTRLSAAQFNLSGVQCVSWNTSADAWSDYGCQVTASTTTSVDCQCNHLTSFATLMDINGVIEDGSVLDQALSWLTTINCIISLFSLAACLVVFTAIPTLRSELIAIHRNLCLSLFVAEFILLVGLEPHGNATACAVVAVLLQFCFLAAFAWMFIEGIQVCLLLAYRVFATKKSYMGYFYVGGYGVPALIVVISLFITRGEGYGTETACWLSTENGLIWAFAGPVLLVLVVNIFVLALAIRVKAQASLGSRQGAVSVELPQRQRGRSAATVGTVSARISRKTGSRASDAKLAATLVRGSASLVTILGTTWLFGFLYFSNGLLFFAVVFTILNSLQGFFIFFFLIWLNEKNHREARRFVMKAMASRAWCRVLQNEGDMGEKRKRREAPRTYQPEPSQQESRRRYEPEDYPQRRAPGQTDYRSPRAPPDYQDHDVRYYGGQIIIPRINYAGQGFERKQEWNHPGWRNEEGRNLVVRGNRFWEQSPAILCYGCEEPGHMRSGCQHPRFVQQGNDHRRLQ